MTYFQTESNIIVANIIHADIKYSCFYQHRQISSHHHY